MSAARIIKPFTVTESALTSSVAEDTGAAWNSGTTYAAEDIVYLASTHRRYESQQGSNLNNNPATDDGTWWLDIGPTNRWAMFDAINGTVTSDNDNIDVEIVTTGWIDSVALLNVAANTVTITADADGDEVYNETYDLQDNTGINSWAAYFFEPLVARTEILVTDLPYYAGMTVSASIVRTGGTASVGTMVLGRAKELGGTIYGARVGINDYSRKVVDEFGNYSIVERAFSKRASLTVVVRGDSMAECASKVDAIHRLLAEYRATPLIWIGAEEYTSTIIFGFFRSFDLEIAYPTQSNLTLDLEGLT